MNNAGAHTCLDTAIDIGKEILFVVEEQQNSSSGPAFEHAAACCHTILSAKLDAVLFLIALYNKTRDQSYLSAAGQMTGGLFKQAQGNAGHYAQRNGWMGIVYALLQLYKATNDDAYLQQALLMARTNSSFFLNNPYAADTLYTGRSGVVLCLLHLHALCPEPWILEQINLYIKKILQHAYVVAGGLCWSHANTNVQPACGVGYGAAGIGYMFLQLGHYFQNESFFCIAEKAFRYENDQWNDELKNWPVYHKEIVNEEQFTLHRQKFLANEHQFFYDMVDDTGFIHGTCGIGLVRLRAMQLLNNSLYQNDVLKACNKLETVYSRLTDNSLNTGRAGHGLFFAQAYAITGDDAFLERAHTIARDIKDEGFRPGTGKASGYAHLLQHLAGIGVFYLQLTHKTPVGVLPDMVEKCKWKDDAVHPYITISISEVRKCIVEKCFPRTYYMAESLYPQSIQDYFSATGNDHPDNFIVFIRDVLAKHTGAYKQEWEAMFHLELTRYEMAQQIDNNALLHMRDIVEIENVAKDLEDEQLFEKWIVLNSGLVLVNTPFNPIINFSLEPDGNFGGQQQPVTTLLRPTTRKWVTGALRQPATLNVYGMSDIGNVQEWQLNPAEALLIEAIKEPVQIGDVVTKLAAMLQGDQAPLESDLFQYVRTFLMAGVIKFQHDYKMDGIQAALSVFMSDTERSRMQ